RPCILIFDSLVGPVRNSGSVIKLLREYLQVEWDMKMRAEHGSRIFNKDTMRGGFPECPQQTNYSDCGIYILQYVQSFFTNPIENYTFPIKLAKWFDETIVCKKRSQLQQLIMKMQV
ncbi:hypothetical protein HELRODRAFT_152590, partial [Helobdella robusta]|uniref:Ubiquitin-like protease family profile domain-containing protein n=1 Tax=Helobdella robusta TaxID=6412 RepID=T1EKU2_HELRO